MREATGLITIESLRYLATGAAFPIRASRKSIIDCETRGERKASPPSSRVLRLCNVKLRNSASRVNVPTQGRTRRSRG